MQRSHADAVSVLDDDDDAAVDDCDDAEAVRSRWLRGSAREEDCDPSWRRGKHVERSQDHCMPNESFVQDKVRKKHGLD